MSSESGGQGPATTVDWSTEGDPIYTNGVQVVCGVEDVALVFTEFQPFEGRAAEPRSMAPRERVVASMRMTPESFFRMLSTMGSVWNRFVLEQGKPDTTPRLRLFGARRFEQLEGTEEA